MFVDSYVRNEVSSNAGGLMIWPARLLVPVGFFLLALQGISELIKRVAFLMGLVPDPAEKPHERRSRSSSPRISCARGEESLAAEIRQAAKPGERTDERASRRQPEGRSRAIRQEADAPSLVRARRPARPAMTAFLIANIAPLMFVSLIVVLLLGYPVAFSLAAVGIATALLGIHLGLLHARRWCRRCPNASGA